ncbi:MAG: chorismate mutase [Chitinispirillaceae bacterium]
MIPIDLQSIAARLEGLEETIISKLIERAQWRSNTVIYTPGKSGFRGEDAFSLFQLRLRYQEEMDARFGRFCVPEERPFFRSLPEPQREVNIPDTGLFIDDYDRVNLSDDILESYMSLVPEICPEGDDGQYGSSVEHDVYTVQAIARRIHFGALYVAESKFRAAPQAYMQLIEQNDREALLHKLTRRNVEERIIERVKRKVSLIQADINRQVRNVIDPEPVVRYYHDTIIPLTKKGEILYLLNRKRSEEQ